MYFTAYGKKLAKEEPNPEITEIGATGHMLACQYDAGKTVILTGTNVHGQAFQKQAKSVYGAFFTAKAVSGIRSAWDIQADGRRKLLFRR